MKIDMKKALYCLLGLTFLQDSSADVTRLKLNDEVTKNFVNNEYRKQGLHIVKIDSKTNFDNIFDADNRNIRDNYKDAIFCNSANEVIIGGIGWLRLAFKKTMLEKQDIKSKIRQIAKQQFKNIISSNLLDGNKFNKLIYNVPFAKRAQMPGISADLSNLTLDELPIMCAMKRQNSDGDTDILKYDKWSSYIASNEISISNKEHTERQLFAYHTSKEAKADNWLKTTQQQTAFHITKQEEDKHLLIYTKESPCSHHTGNGEMCCWELYNLLPENINVDVYFTEMDKLDLHKENTIELAFGINDFSVLLNAIESDVKAFKTLRDKLQHNQAVTAEDFLPLNIDKNDFDERTKGDIQLEKKLSVLVDMLLKDRNRKRSIAKKMIELSPRWNQKQNVRFFICD